MTMPQPHQISVAAPDLVAESRDSSSAPPRLSGVGLARSINDDLAQLTTSVAQNLAASLRGAVDSLHFDQLNELIRADYGSHPLPQTSFQALRESIGKYEGLHISATEAQALRFFLLGDALSQGAVAEILGAQAPEIIEAGISVGLFCADGQANVALNGLLLASRKCGDDVLYFFADTPSNYSQSAGIQRVYTGPDSYFLNAKVQSMSGIQGIVAEAGSGSGIQLLTALSLNPEVEKAIGIECDARARNVSAFNAALNGLSERFSLVNDADALNAELAGRKLALAISNPPFMACPDTVRLSKSGDSLNLRALFSRAGWGGPDGLQITTEFVQMFAPHMDAGSEIVIYSQFAGSAASPENKAYELRNVAGVSHSIFEGFPNDAYCAYSFDLTSKDWPRYIAGVTVRDHPELTLDDQFSIEMGVARSLREQGIEKFHSGFLTLSKGDSVIIHDNLRNYQGRLDLFWMKEGTPPPIEHSATVFAKESLLPPPGVGWNTYKAPESGIYFGSIKLDHVFLERELNAPGEPATKLLVGKYDGDFFYLVKCGDQTLEFGPVEVPGQYQSKRYEELISAVRVLPPHQVLRNLKSESGGILSPGRINSLYSSKHTSEFWLEILPVLHKFRVVYPSQNLGEELSSGFGSKVFRSGSVFSIEFLRLCEQTESFLFNRGN